MWLTYENANQVPYYRYFYLKFQLNRADLLYNSISQITSDESSYFMARRFKHNLNIKFFSTYLGLLRPLPYVLCICINQTSLEDNLLS